MMNGAKVFFILFVGFCLAADPSNASPASPNHHLRQALRRSIRATPRIDPASCVDTAQCSGSPDICKNDPSLGAALCPIMCGACVCQDNLATQGNCTALAPDVCKGDFGATLCPKTCGVCGTATANSCYDHVTGITCADLPYPCNDELGKIACPKFCGFCTSDPATTQAAATTPKNVCANAPCLNGGVCSLASNVNGFACSCPTPYTGTICESKIDTTTSTPTTTAASGPCANAPCLNNGQCQVASNAFGFECTCPAPYSGTICETKAEPATTTPAASVTSAQPGGATNPPPAGSCSPTLKDQNSLPCQEGEIIFMIEYGYKDSTNSIDHEGDFVKELVDAWRIKDSGIRFGVVIYHDTASQEIHINDYKNNPDGLKNRISSLTRGLRPSNSADLGKALDFVRENSFKNARPGAVKVVIPIIHQMDNKTKSAIVPAAQRLKDECISIVGVAVGDDTLDYDVLHQTVSQPYASFYSYHRSYYDMENSAKWVHYFYPGCHPSRDSNSRSGAAATTTTASPTTTHHHHSNNRHHNNNYGNNGRIYDHDEDDD